MTVSRVTIHHQGGGAPTDNSSGYSYGGYTYGIGVTKWERFRSVADSFGTYNYNGDSVDVCLSGDRHTGYPVTDKDIELIGGAVADARARGEVIDAPTVCDHSKSPGSATACSGNKARERWNEIVAACMAGGATPAPPTKKGGAMEIQRTKSGRGYYVVGADGGIFCYGDAKFHGSMGGQHLNAPIVGMALRPQDDGYLLVGSDGGIFAFGKAPFHGSMGGKKLNKPIVDIEFDAEGDGYWMLAEDGGIFTFGETAFYGAPTGKV